MYPQYKQKIIDFYERHKRMPAYAEIMKLVGFKSKNAVHKLVNRLVEEGVLQKDSTGRLIPNSLFSEVPFLGLVEAGIPTTADTLSDTMSLDDYLVGDRNKTFVLEVKGDSMIEEGIKEGDLVIVERRGEPKDGDIVIAEIDGGWTMKYFRRRAGRTYLEPANRTMKAMYPEYDLKVAAIVRGVVRKY